jgi:methyl-accepting chemotaxis protein
VLVVKKRFNLKSIRMKILLGFSIVIFFTLILGTYNYYAVQKINKDTKNIVNDQLPLLIADEKLTFNIAQRIALARAYVLYGDESYKEEFHQYTEDSKAIQEQVLELSDSERAKVLISTSIHWREIIENHVFAEYDRGNKEMAAEILAKDSQPIARELMKGFAVLSEEREGMIEQEGQNVIQSGESNLLVGMLISVLVIVIGIVAATITARKITKPVTLVMDRMNAIASGDLSQESLKTKSKDEIGQLVIATNQMNDKMRELLGQIGTVSETVSGQSEELTQSANEVKEGSHQIASTMQELASGSESQANNASELASAMQSFSAQVQEVNANGDHIHKSSKEVLEMTIEGGQLMTASIKQMAAIDQIVQDAVQKVHGLDSQSQEISKLVSVIKDIADQTNLLALNAAIEAARAGEHGRGFAVVADEVRKLAEQVALSVTDITGIVESIQKESSVVTESLQGGYNEVEQGTNQIKTTGETFDRINNAVSEMVNRIQAVSGNLETISTNSQEMNTSIDEIASISEESAAGVEQTSASVQQTSSSMEEVAGSSDELAKLAEELNGLVRQFKL